MEYVFYLKHSYEEADYDFVTDIGIYSSLDKAQRALFKFKNYPKFKEHPESFNIHRYRVDESNFS